MGDDVEERITRCADVSGMPSGELGALVEALYDHVRRISAHEMRQAFRLPLDALTVQPTAIANDAIMRVLQQRNGVTNPDQFFALATQFVRQLILDYRRHRLAQKRGGGSRGVRLDETNDVPDRSVDEDSCGDVLPLLQALQEQYPRKAEVVTLHVTCGHPLEKVAQMLDISRATAVRDWAFAKAWLANALDQRKNSP